MDFDELLRRYAEGKRDFQKIDLGGVDLRVLGSVDLTGVNLAEANLAEANLGEVILANANLSGANLQAAHLGGVDLKLANLAKVNVRGAAMRRVSLMAANLTEADLTDADLAGANLAGADLKGATLANANLESAALDGVRHLSLDRNFIKNARFSPNARDRWSILRRKYTGPLLAFHLLLLMVFVIPYVLRTALWLGINRSQTALVATTAELKKAAVELEVTQHPSAPTIAQLAGHLGNLQPCLQSSCREWSVWQLLLGVDKGLGIWLLTISLFIYNLGRGVLTRLVGPLRDEEERSGYSPALRQYRYLYFVHVAVATLFYVSIVSFVWHAWHWLGSSVWLPG